MSLRSDLKQALVSKKKGIIKRPACSTVSHPDDEGQAAALRQREARHARPSSASGILIKQTTLAKVKQAEHETANHMPPGEEV